MASINTAGLRRARAELTEARERALKHLKMRPLSGATPKSGGFTLHHENDMKILSMEAAMKQDTYDTFWLDYTQALHEQNMRRSWWTNLGMLIVAILMFLTTAVYAAAFVWSVQHPPAPPAAQGPDRVAPEESD